ncbi:unnamed protein product [Rotaria sordida]|uniref:Uncharacterized protein n=1 Tax=Rotaria sordida TaxID=392033 RepID=A0A813ND20_9BILA|nr:unnamed protein product [Rotaria sordida]CAF0823924.1 unnamed protein product [Rotaria sordida]CAF3553147.1 unnamed protein product [Rotaria sordida]CAF3669930.1 unnamed protein product [Rotaria sordida]
MSSVRLSLLCLFVVIYPIQSSNPNCKSNYNTNPIVRHEPTFVSSVSNEKRFVVESGYNKINIVHVYGGTPYDPGYALGSLMSKESNELIPKYFVYLDKTIEDELTKTFTKTVYYSNASYEGYTNHFHEYYKQQNYASHAFANFGYLGLIGSIGAYSETSIGLVHFGLGSYECNNISMINDEHIGFHGIEYSTNELNVYNREDMFDTPNHPRLKDIVYWDKHVQPSNDPCLGSLLVEDSDHLNAVDIMRNMTSRRNG